MSYKLLIDGDIVAFQAAAATDGRCYTLSNGEEFKYKKQADKRAKETDCTIELSYKPEPEAHTIYLVKKKLLDIEETLDDRGFGGEVSIYLSSGGSFREKDVNPRYKANREGMRRPANLEAAKQYLLNHQKAELRAGEYEADDLITMEAKAMEAIGVEPIICSIDKDLKQYPCWFYNFDKRDLHKVTEDEALRNFYTQLLTGDATDGIIGIKGVGPKTAEKILAPHSTSWDMYCAVLGEWVKRSPREDEEDEPLFYQRILATVRMTGKLLYLAREEGDLWEAPSKS